MSAQQRWFTLSPLVAALLLGCQGSVDSGPSGKLSLAVTDAPIDDADNVFISFDRVELHHSDGETLSLNVDETAIDLLALQGTEFDFLFEQRAIRAGSYDWIRLYLNTTNDVDSPSYIVIEGQSHPLEIPSNSQTGLKLNHSFTLPEEGAVALTIDFDLRRSIVTPSPGQISGGNTLAYKLKPTLRLVENDQIGSISGKVAETLISNQCSSDRYVAVYLYSGSGVTADDTGSGNEPLTSTLVSYNGANSAYEYNFGFIEAGDYTLAYTCDANLDDPESDDTILFHGTTSISVEIGLETLHDFN